MAHWTFEFCSLSRYLNHDLCKEGLGIEPSNRDMLLGSYQMALSDNKKQTARYQSNKFVHMDGQLGILLLSKILEKQYDNTLILWFIG